MHSRLDRRETASERTAMGRTIDMHAHVFTPACQELVAGLMEPRYDPFMYWAGEETREYQTGHMRTSSRS
jgi:hypothetical protein